MDIKELFGGTDPAWVNPASEACDTQCCAEYAPIMEGEHVGKWAVRFTETNPNDAVVATAAELGALGIKVSGPEVQL